jgi:hypothetical protein
MPPQSRQRKTKNPNHKNPNSQPKTVGKRQQQIRGVSLSKYPWQPANLRQRPPSRIGQRHPSQGHGTFYKTQHLHRSRYLLNRSRLPFKQSHGLFKQVTAPFKQVTVPFGIDSSRKLYKNRTVTRSWTEAAGFRSLHA